MHLNLLEQPFFFVFVWVEEFLLLNERNKYKRLEDKKSSIIQNPSWEISFQGLVCEPHSLLHRHPNHSDEDHT